MKKTGGTFLLGLLISAAVVVSLTISIAVYQRHRAASFLREFVALQVGVATFADAQRISQKYGATSSGIKFHDSCAIRNCSMAFIFTNWLLEHRQGERRVSLSAGITIKDGKVISRELDYSILAKSLDHQFMYISFDRATPVGKEGYIIK